VYDAHARVAKFVASHEDAELVLRAYSEVDPFRCYSGDEVNPDEYLGYAKRFCNYKSGTTLEKVKRSFYDSQWYDGWITEADCEQIAERIEA
jgi:hypothetical protein